MPNQNPISIPSASNASQIIINGAKSFAKKHKIITGSYIFGLLVLLLAGSGYKLSTSQQRDYNRMMSTIDLNAEYEASNRYHSAYSAYYATKGWFTCDYLCQRNKKRMDDSKRVLDSIRAEGYNRMSDAKSIAGLFSEVGVGEVKDSFWEYFASGKRFAKRQSMWDAMFMGMRSMSRDENMAEYVFKVLIQVLLNFSMGLVMALIFFIFGLWTIIKSYQPDPFTALVFFVSTACAGFAFVSSYLFLIYGAAAGGVYGVAKIAETNMRIAANANANQGGQQGQGRRNNVGYRPHYE